MLKAYWKQPRKTRESFQDDWFRTGDLGRFDADGNLVVAVRAESRPGICFYSPKGKEIAYLETEVPTNVGFGRGENENLLYITAGQSLYRIRLNTRGYLLPAPK